MTTNSDGGSLLFTIAIIGCYSSAKIRPSRNSKTRVELLDYAHAITSCQRYRELCHLSEMHERRWGSYVTKDAIAEQPPTQSHPSGVDARQAAGRALIGSGVVRAAVYVGSPASAAVGGRFALNAYLPDVHYAIASPPINDRHGYC